MKGSVMEAMADAIEGAALMLYGVSLAYKESANCRLEANYAMNMQLDMIPVSQPTCSEIPGSEAAVLKRRVGPSS